MASPQMKERLSSVVLNTVSKGASPESKCPICLDHFKNISYLDVCLHKFCFCCIHEWSKNKAECPLCKQPFNSIYHTIKSEDNYKRFDLRPTENGSFGNMAGQRFRYRTTLTGNRRPAPRRTSPPPDHGVIFEGLRGSLPQRHNRDLHSMLRRLAVRQRREREGRSVQSLREQEMVKFRRALYRRGVQVQSVQDGGRSRETSAEFFRRNPACLHRLVPWLRRELTVLYGSHGSLVNIVQHIIMTLITRHNLDDQAVVHDLRPFLLSHTEHFLHEFLCFAQSPFNMEAYDQRAVYDLPRPSGEGSSSETSVIAISEDESDSLVSGSQDYATPSLTLSQTAWDDETPGPSYSSEPSQVLPFPVRDSDSDSSVGEAVVSVAAVPHQDHPANTGTIAVEEEHSASSEDDCVIISYVKPVSERTPELVQLSSDSEHSEQNVELRSPRAPQHIRFTSESDLSPTDTQRTSRRPTRCSRSPENTTSHPRKEDKYGKGHHERELSGSREGSLRSNRIHFSSRSRKHPLSKESKHKCRREKETSHHTSSYWHSYSHYSQRDSSRRCYTETRSSYTSYYRSVHDRFRSQSHSRRRSRDRQDRSHSRSNSRIKSSSSNRQDRSCSRSNSGINSNHQDRSRSRSRSRIKFSSSNRQHRRRSRSNSRINSSSSHQTSRHDDHGRKKKYKTKHHEESSCKLFTDSVKDDAKKKYKKHHKKFKRKSRSPSRDDKSEGQSRKHHKKKKKHKRKSRRRNSEERVGKNSPVLITISSDSDSADPSEPSTSNICAAGSIVPIANSATETQPLMSRFLDMEQESTAGTGCSSVGDAGNHPPDSEFN
ncbi:topoisomerase I binding, arginine/serine-rich a [Sinocyclocheilus grahami]|uniref:E3 ubiquitin-protein ligase Topors n=1 Tax=Sinocyclocheilus grahami TaxID=75366 RepID=A0A672LZ46_SINGR|nr:PREDICTED: E3 ubiquitin-protein ligase Topors [Sinocyclocheilus grahami]XP_016140810.1 PREDICTED: E3 ubiquitin-protein ligase Topors [Sinocyclocheilus grahami]XP_016140811.1 PREDICTED: E3 ubiquitin-protein ligase Topors [Sinocyclocheilus grahami]